MQGLQASKLLLYLCARSQKQAAARLLTTMTSDSFYAELKSANGAYKWHCAGKWAESTSGKTVGVINPSTRQKEFEVQACTREEVDAAFAAAKEAQRAWARTPLWQRAAVLHKAAGFMRQHAQPMADALVKEIAKPAKDSMSEVLRCAFGFGFGWLGHSAAAREGGRRCSCVETNQRRRCFSSNAASHPTNSRNTHNVDITATARPT
jgi:hypothetical protein